MKLKIESECTQSDSSTLESRTRLALMSAAGEDLQPLVEGGPGLLPHEEDVPIFAERRHCLLEGL